MKVCQESKCLTADKFSLDLSSTRWDDDNEKAWKKMGAEDGGSERPKVSISATGPKVYMSLGI
jgi:hypothetical protein